MPRTQAIITTLLFSGIPLLVAADGLTKGSIRLQGPRGLNQPGSGRAVRRKDSPGLFWAVTLLLLLASAVALWACIALLDW